MKYGLMSAACYALATLLLMAFGTFGWPFWAAEYVAAGLFGFATLVLAIFAVRHAPQRKVLAGLAGTTLSCTVALGFSGSPQNHYAAIILVGVLGLFMASGFKMRGRIALHFIALQVGTIAAFWVMESRDWPSGSIARFGIPSVGMCIVLLAMALAQKHRSIFDALDFKLPALNKEDEQLLDWSSHQL